MPNIYRWCPVVMALACGSAAAQDGGLVSPPGGLGGALGSVSGRAFWQTRFERDSLLPSATGTNVGVLLGLPSQAAQTLRLISDYQFSTLRLGQTGSLRLSGGLLINLRPATVPGSSGDTSSALPYAGIGYASGNLRGDWGFSADLGLAAQGLGSARLDRLFNGNGALSVDGSLRLLPVLRLGVNMAF